jgi:hypothetical protein
MNGDVLLYSPYTLGQLHTLEHRMDYYTDLEAQRLASVENQTRIEELQKRLYDDVGKELLRFETRLGSGAIYEGICSYLSPDGLSRLEMDFLTYDLEGMRQLDFGAYLDGENYETHSISVLIRHMVEYQYELFLRELWSDLPIQMFEEVIKNRMWLTWYNWFNDWTYLDEDSDDWLEEFGFDGVIESIVRGGDYMGFPSIKDSFEFFSGIVVNPQQWNSKGAGAFMDATYDRTPYSPSPLFPDSFQKKCIDAVDMAEWMMGESSVVVKGVQIATISNEGMETAQELHDDFGHISPIETVSVNNLPPDALSNKLIGFIRWRDILPHRGFKSEQEKRLEATLSLIFVGANAQFSLVWRLIFPDDDTSTCLYNPPSAWTQMHLTLSEYGTSIPIDAWERDIICIEPVTSGVGKTLNYPTNAFAG